MQERYERHHQCIFDEDALIAAVTLSTRYIPDRYLPDKAIDVMDEAASRVRIQTYEARRAAVVGRLHVLEWENLVQVLDAKDEAVQVCCLITTCHTFVLTKKNQAQPSFAVSFTPISTYSSA